MKEMPEITVTIAKKRWRLLFRDLKEEWGFCNPPDHPGKSIVIHSGITDPEKLVEVVIHEALHCSDWTKDEEWVETVARDIARVLTRLSDLGILQLGSYNGPTPQEKK